MLLWLLIWLRLRTAAIQIWEYGRANDSLGDFALPAGVCPRIIAKGSETDIVGSHEGRDPRPTGPLFARRPAPTRQFGSYRPQTLNGLASPLLLWVCAHTFAVRL